MPFQNTWSVSKILVLTQHQNVKTRRKEIANLKHKEEYFLGNLKRIYLLLSYIATFLYIPSRNIPITRVPITISHIFSYKKPYHR